MPFCSFFFFNDTATTEIYTLSLHDALPISRVPARAAQAHRRQLPEPHAAGRGKSVARGCRIIRSEEHTSELQSHLNLVCRLLLEKKKSSNEKQSLNSSPTMIHREESSKRHH